MDTGFPVWKVSWVNMYKWVDYRLSIFQTLSDSAVKTTGIWLNISFSDTDENLKSKRTLVWKGMWRKEIYFLRKAFIINQINLEDRLHKKKQIHDKFRKNNVQRDTPDYLKIHSGREEHFNRWVPIYDVLKTLGVLLPDMDKHGPHSIFLYRFLSKLKKENQKQWPLHAETLTTHYRSGKMAQTGPSRSVK
jgi:hypothetical protein